MLEQERPARDCSSDVCDRRPLPTPCRAAMCPPLLAEEDMVSTEAVTTICSDERASRISIADAVGPSDFDVAKNCVDLMTTRDADAFWELTKPWQAGSLAVNLDALELHANTTLALEQVQNFAFLTSWMFTLMARPKKGGQAYAVVILARRELLKSLQLLGGFGGDVWLNVEDSLYVGATSPDAFTGELIALLWAALWCLGHWTAFGCPRITFHFDATHAGSASSGAWSCHEHPLGPKARAVMRLLEQFVGVSLLEWLHVKSHEGVE